MKVIDLIKTCDIKKTKQEWDKVFNIYEFDKFPSEILDDYLPKLLDITIIENKNSLKITDGIDEFDNKYYVNVSGVVHESDEKYSFGFEPLGEWLFYDVNNETELSNDKILAHIIWEMTFYGFTDEDRYRVKKDLSDRSDDVDKWIEEGTLDDHTCSLKDVKKLFEREDEEV